MHVNRTVIIMRRRDLAGASGAILLTLAALARADAAPGYVVQGINLRAGPGVDYPWIASLPPGTPADIFGCLPDYTWCDVATVGTRGWVAGVGLNVLYGQQPEPLVAYGPQVIPFIGFDFNTYWGTYYRGRPWFSDVDRWHGGGPGRFDRGPGGDRGPGFDRGPAYGRGPGPDRGPGFAGPGRGPIGPDRPGGYAGPGGRPGGTPGPVQPGRAEPPGGGQRPGPEGRGGPDDHRPG